MTLNESAVSEEARCWIAVDWGTTNCRAWLVTAEGQVIESRYSSCGMASLQPEEFEPALLTLVGQWLDGPTPVRVVACGMVGAKQGWHDAGYREVPCSPMLPGCLSAVPTIDKRIEVGIVPGLCQLKPADVMRGEETQIAGCLAVSPANQQTICLPGTHTKWVVINDGVVQSFRSFVSGELFKLICDHSVIGKAMEIGKPEYGIFSDAVEECLERVPVLTAELFGIRARSLLGQLDGGAAASRLSGLLIGTEVAAIKAELPLANLRLIAAPELEHVYGTALELAKIPFRTSDPEEATLRGLLTAWDET